MDRATKKLIKKLESANAKERYAAVLALGKKGDIELIDPLDRVANLDQHPKVRDLASKAVKTLETLRQRQVVRERKIQQVAHDDDGTIDWPELSKDKIMKERDISIKEGSADWDYMEAKKRDVLSKTEQQRKRMEATEAEKRERAAALRRRRRPFRILLWMAVTFAVIGLAFVGWYLTNVDTPPETRVEAVKDLQTWKDAEQSALDNYQTQFQQDPLDCKSLQDVARPDRPRWTELIQSDEETLASRGGLNGIADDLSMIDESLVEGLDPLLTDLIRVDLRLTDMRNSVETACQGRETVLQVEWAEYSQMGGYMAQAQNSLADATGILKQISPPANRLEVLVGLQDWATAQQPLVVQYQQLLGTEPINCDLLRGISAAPPKPNWLVTLPPDDPLLTGLDAITSALNEADATLATTQQATLAACGTNSVLDTSTWAGFTTAKNSIDSAIPLLESSLVILGDEINKELGQ